MKTRPGVMLYFDQSACIRALPDEAAGKLTKGILTYAESGKEPTFDDVLSLVWMMVRPLIDRDGQRYTLQCTKKSYAVYCREQQKQGLPKLSFEDWQRETEGLVSLDDGRYPNTMTYASPSTPSSSAPTTSSPTSSSAYTDTASPSDTAPSAYTAGDCRAQAEKAERGHYGANGTIRLTTEEYRTLCGEMGEEKLLNVIPLAETFAAGKGYDAETLDWQQYLRFFANRH